MPACAASGCTSRSHGGKPILPAGFEGYTGAAWSELVASSPMTAGCLEILFRMYGVFNLIVGFMGISIAATAFRRGDDWAWWTLLVGNTMALVVPRLSAQLQPVAEIVPNSLCKAPEGERDTRSLFILGRGTPELIANCHTGAGIALEPADQSEETDEFRTNHPT